MFKFLSFLIFNGGLVFTQPLFASVVTTSPTLEAILREVAPKHVKVESLVKPDQNPHHLEVSLKDIQTTKAAKVIFAVGFDYESSWLPKLLKTSKKQDDPLYLGIYLEDPIAIDEQHTNGHAKDHVNNHTKAESLKDGVKDDVKNNLRDNVSNRKPFNPHFLVSPLRLKNVLPAIEKKLIATYPNAKHEIQKNKNKFVEELQIFHQKLQTKMAKLSNKNIFTYHNSFDYLAKDYGLNVVSTVEAGHGVNPGPQRLKELLELQTKNSVQCLFYDSTYNAEQIAQMKKLFPQTLKWVELPAEASASFFGWLNAVSEKILGCLGG